MLGMIPGKPEYFGMLEAQKDIAFGHRYSHDRAKHRAVEYADSVASGDPSTLFEAMGRFLNAYIEEYHYGLRETRNR